MRVGTGWEARGWGWGCGWHRLGVGVGTLIKLPSLPAVRVRLPALEGALDAATWARGMAASGARRSRSCSTDLEAQISVGVKVHVEVTIEVKR